MKKTVIIACLYCCIPSINAEPIRVACVGNSITSGSADPKTDINTYPAQLQVLLGAEYDVRNFGVSGRTMLNKGDDPLWDEPAFSEALEFRPHIVTILLGTNDSKPWNWDYKDEFIPDYIAMIDTFRSLDSSPEIWVGLPPPAFSVQWGIRDSIITTDIIPMIRQIAEQKETRLIDFYAPFIDSNDLFPDDIHPNKEGVWEFAKIIYNHLTGKTVREVKDVNLARNGSVSLAGDNEDIPTLIDRNIHTYHACSKGESYILDIGRPDTVGAVQIIFRQPGSNQYLIETSLNRSEWIPLIDRSAQSDTIAVAQELIEPSPAQYIRFTFDRADDDQGSIPVSELRVLRPAPVHAPVLTYEIVNATSRVLRLDVNIRAFGQGGCLKYYYSTGGDDSYSLIQSYRQADELQIRASVRIDAVRSYFAKYCKDGYEVVSDTVRFDYTLSKAEANRTIRPEYCILEQNYPNPFNPETTIEFTMPSSGLVEIKIIDVLGRQVRELVSQQKSAGHHQVTWNGMDDHENQVASGVYLCVFKTEGYTRTRKSLLIR